jgi:hypothetical protein
VPDVFREIDGRHAARPKLALDAVPVGERSAEPLEGAAHRFASSTARFIRLTKSGMNRR